MGLGVDNYSVAEDFQPTGQDGVVNQGWVFSISRSSPASHDPSPALGDSDWTDLRDAARISEALFATAAAALWGSWWTSKSATQQTRIWRVVESTRSRP